MRGEGRGKGDFSRDLDLIRISGLDCMSDNTVNQLYTKAGISSYPTHFSQIRKTKQITGSKWKMYQIIPLVITKKTSANNIYLFNY